jgi:hypothetical protein
MAKSLKIPKGVIRSRKSKKNRPHNGITPFGIFKLFAIVLFVLLRFTASDYPLWYLQAFRHCVVCSSSIYGFWLPPLVFSSFSPKSLKIPKKVIRSRKSKKNRQHNGEKLENTKGVIRSRKSKKNRQHNYEKLEDIKGGNQKPSNFSPLCCLFFFDLRLLITPFGIFKVFVFVLSVLLRFTASDYPLCYLQTFRHCVVCSSSIYGFWLPPLISSSFVTKSLKITKGVIRSRKSKKNRQHSDEKFEDTKGGNQKP